MHADVARAGNASWHVDGHGSLHRPFGLAGPFVSVAVRDAVLHASTAVGGPSAIASREPSAAVAAAAAAAAATVAAAAAAAAATAATAAAAMAWRQQ